MTMTKALAGPIPARLTGPLNFSKAGRVGAGKVQNHPALYISWLPPPIHRRIYSTHTRPFLLVGAMIPRQFMHTSSPKREIAALEARRMDKSLMAGSHDEELALAASASKKASPLSLLPLTTILRSWATLAISSSPLLLQPALAIVSTIANSNSVILDPDRNFLLGWLIKNTLYAQFCAGENGRDVQQTIKSLKNMGYSGVILGHAREVHLADIHTDDLMVCAQGGEAADECVRREVIPWAKGTIETIQLAQAGDYVAIKLTGAGRLALACLVEQKPAPPALAQAIDEMCELATQRGVRLLFDAEQHAVQASIDQWTLHYMQKYNSPTSATVYGTYQAYLKAAPAILSRHLSVAQAQNFALGVKLVRGAYLSSDPRHIIHDTKDETDAAYDNIIKALLEREWTVPLIRPPSTLADSFPRVDVVVASHNQTSVQYAHQLATFQAGKADSADGGGGDVAIAQLQGMADDVSCELVATITAWRQHELATRGREVCTRSPHAFKYLVWGSTRTCMKYLLRRAYENQDAVQRTQVTKEAMQAELWRRLKGFFGLA